MTTSSMRESSLRADLALALDPVRFAEVAGYELDDWQREVVLARPRRLLLNCARQVGKSLVAALLAVHQAMYEDGSLAVVAAVAQRQAIEMIRTCRQVYAALGRPIEAESENMLSLELANSSRILSIPATEATVRGLSGVKLLILDEAARIPDAFYGATLPFLATSDGALALLSTPCGRRGFFYDAYRRREQDGWFYREIHAEQCSRIPASFLAEMRRTTSEAFYQQEFCGAFNDATTGAFRQADIAAAITTYPRWGLRRFIAESAEEIAAGSLGSRGEAQEDFTTTPVPTGQQEATGSWHLNRYLNRSGIPPARP